MQSLEFDLIVYAPYRSVEGFTDYMEVCLVGSVELFLNVYSFLHFKINLLLPLIFFPVNNSMACLPLTLHFY
jgi:hypothetical protein